MRKTQITIDVELDENNIPEKLAWSAPDGGVEGHETKALIVSVWDSAEKEAMRLDLWTKDMPLEEMKAFFHQIFISMASTYERATNEEETATYIIEFAENFAHKAGLKG